MKVFVDGAANMHIKRCGIGCVFDNGEIISEEIDYGTNNDAEYIGLIRALEHAIETGIDELDVYMDSMLVVKQVNREWKINYPHLRVHNNRVQELKKKVKRFTFPLKYIVISLISLLILGSSYYIINGIIKSSK